MDIPKSSISYDYSACVSFSWILLILKLLSGLKRDLQNNVIEDIFSSKYCPSHIPILETMTTFSHTLIFSILNCIW